MNFYKLFFRGLLVGGLLSTAGAALAKQPQQPQPTAAEQPATEACPSDGSESTKWGLSLSDMTWEGAPATSCYGVVEGNDKGGQAGLYKSLWPDTSNEITFLTQSSTNPSNPAKATWLGIEFSLSAYATNDDKPVLGAWELAWADTNGAQPTNLPTYADFVAALKGGNGFAAYFFDGILLSDTDFSGDGSFKIAFPNWNNFTGPLTGFSHLSLYVRSDSRELPPPEQPTGRVPIPGTIALLGVGLLGLGIGGFRRRLR